MSDIALSVAIQALDRFSTPAQKIAGVSGQLAKALGDGQSKLSKLEAQAAKASGLQTLEHRLGRSGAALDVARREVSRLAHEMRTAEHPTRAMQSAFAAAQEKVRRLADQHRHLREQVRGARGELREAGVDTERLGQQVQATTRHMEALARSHANVEAARKAHDASLQRAANISLVAGGMERYGRLATRALADPVTRMRAVERARGELQSLGMQNIDVVVAEGRAMSRRLAGVTTDAFVSAAYDIKSGIAALSDEGVAKMTGLAALTAKATKSSTEQMTSLFATAYGSFKESLFPDLTDAEFGSAFAGQLSASVQQFKTTGAAMQQAIQSMGSGLAASGIAMSEQLAALGLLQQKMEAGVAGTTLKALERSAAQAQERFDKLGVSVQTLDEKGNLRSLADLLEEMQRAFGKEYSTEIGDLIRQGFGTDEAVAFFKNLWGQHDALRKSNQALIEAGRQGEKFADSMARMMDRNMDARLTLMRQRWESVQELIGYSLVPSLEKLLPTIERVVSWVVRWVELHPNLTAAGTALVGGFGILALATAPVITAIGSLAAVMTLLKLRAAEAAASTALANAAGGGAIGGAMKKGGGFKGVLGKTVKAAPAVTAAIGAVSVLSTLGNKDMSGADKAQSIAADVGGVGGVLAGTLAGAAIGSVVPIIGTTVGGFVGGIVGGFGGGLIGDKAGGAIAKVLREKEEERDVAEARPSRRARRLSRKEEGTEDPIKLASSEPIMLGAAAGATSFNVGEININATANQDPQEVARQVRRELEAMTREYQLMRRGRLSD